MPYGSGVVASVPTEFLGIIENCINKYPVEHLFETPHLHVLNDALMARGQKICFIAKYFPPDVNILRPLDCPYSTFLKVKSGDAIEFGSIANALFAFAQKWITKNS